MSMERPSPNPEQAEKPVKKYRLDLLPGTLKEFVKFRQLSEVDAKRLIACVEEGKTEEELMAIFGSKMRFVRHALESVEVEPGELEGETPYRVMVDGKEVEFGIHRPNERVLSETYKKQILRRGLRPATQKEGKAFAKAHPELKLLFETWDSSIQKIDYFTARSRMLVVRVANP